MMGQYGDDERAIGGAFPRTILSLLLIMGGIMLCMVSLIVGIDTACNINIDRWMPVYPGAEEVSTQYDFLRPRGMGNTFIIFQTSDDVATVRRWYADYQHQMMRESGDRSNIHGFARTNFQITENPERTATLIYHMSDCATG